jgi:hypothetical protein
MKRILLFACQYYPAYSLSGERMGSLKREENAPHLLVSRKPL